MLISPNQFRARIICLPYVNFGIPIKSTSPWDIFIALILLSLSLPEYLSTLEEKVHNMIMIA